MRTGRHLTVDKPRKWNLDWVMPRGTQVAVWWTYERRHVEFDWVDLFSGLPGATVPVAGFGSSDNPAAEAHLIRFDAMPPLRMFPRRVAEAMPGHTSVEVIAVQDRTGHGWPE